MQDIKYEIRDALVDVSYCIYNRVNRLNKKLLLWAQRHDHTHPSFKHRQEPTNHA